MQVLPGQRGSVDPDVIQALGQSIANQLAKFMTGDSKKPRKKSPSQRVAKDTRWEYPMLPGDRFERTPSPTLPDSPSAALFVTSPNHEASVWAPQQQRRRRKSKLRSQVLHSLRPNDDDAVDVNEHINPLQSDPPSHMATTIGDEAEGILDIDCYNCGATDSRVWRTGPGGRLCDSCGTYYRRYGLLKAVEDPSLTPITRIGRGRSSAHDGDLSRNQEIDVFAIPSTDAPGSAAGYAANTARRVTGDGRNGRFTLEEEESIIRHHEIDQLSWDHIGYLLSLRSAHSVHSHYQKFLKAPGCEARRRILDPKVRTRPLEIEVSASEHRPNVAEPKGIKDTNRHDVSGFIEREDELIVRLREDEGMTWEQIAAYFPDRTSHALEAHYNEVLVENESSSSVSDPNVHALGVQSEQRLFNDGSLTPMPPQTTHNLPIARPTADDDFATSGDHNFDAPRIDATPSMSHPYATILNMTDEQAMPFKEMAQLFRDKTDENLVGQYINHQARPASSKMNRITNTSGTSDTANTIPPSIGDDARSWSIKSASNTDTHTQMPPPQVPSRQAAASPAIGAGRYRAQHLHTPSVHARQASVPPRPSEVGPSAWAITQPVSKGPLPFQPARKGLVPIYPKLSSRGLYDPFISRTITPADLTGPCVQNEYGMIGPTRSDANPDPQSTKASAPRFTPEQDSFIKKAREKRRLAWAEIAATMPGDVQHTASAITHRYYDYLLGKRSATKTSQSQGAQASVNDGRSNGGMQSDQASLYMQQGNPETEATDMIPVPSSIPVNDHGNGARPKEAHQQLAPHQRHPQKPLLRRALRNSTRRNSDVATTSTLPEDHVQSSLRQNPEGGSSCHSSVVSQLHELRPHAHPEVVISSGEFRDLDDTSKLSNANTARGAISKSQCQPNHVSRISDSNSMDVDSDQSHAQASRWEEASSDEYTPAGDHDIDHQEVQDAMSVLVHKTQAKKGRSSSGTKRKRPRRRSSRVSGVEIADSDSDVPYQYEGVQADAHDTPPAKRGRGRPRKSGLSFNGTISREVMPEPEAQAVDLTEPISPKLRSGLIRTAIGDDVQSMTKNAPHLVVGTWRAPGAVDESLTVAHEWTSRPDGGQDEQNLTYQTWEEILVACFRSQLGAELRCRDISAWVRAHSSHYRNTTEPWIHHVYNEIYRNPAFEKADSRNTRSAYVFDESKLRPGTTEQAGGDDNEDQAEARTPSTSAEHTVDDTPNKDQAEPDLRAASTERADANACTQNKANVRPISEDFSGQDFTTMENSMYPAAKPSHNIIGDKESNESDALVIDLPALASPVSRPTGTSGNIVEVIDISSGSPIKQEPASENEASTSQARHSTKRLLNAQEQSPRVKHMRHSGPAPVRRVSALVTPACSSGNSGRLGLSVQSTAPIDFGSLFGEGARASPATSVGTSGRRVVVATKVARDDGDEQDELS
jgi:hypothetical protein